jgi:hypothetical protein
MARNDKVKFRREYTITSDGYLGDSTGLFVGDILSLHIDIVSNKASIVVEGKIGHTGDWNKIAIMPNAESLMDIDLREYEYVRIHAYNVDTSTKIVLFGYDVPVLQREINVIQSKEDERRNIDNNIVLKEMLEELKKINIHLSLIDEEEGI